MDKSLLLLQTMLKSTSPFNQLKYSKDKKKRRQLIINLVGMVVAYAFLMIYCGLTCFGYGQIGLISCVPVMVAIMISALSFFLTLLRCNGYLFHFKEYDMLMALPFETKTIAGMKFLYMYVKCLPWYVAISLPMMVGYGYYRKPSMIVYPIWMLLSLMLPVIPMLAASVIGFFITKISAGFRLKNLVQTLLLFLVILFCFSLRFIIEALFKNGQVEQSLENISEILNHFTDVYIPAKWFTNAVVHCRISDMLLLSGITILLFELVFLMVGRSYRQINSALMSHGMAKAYVMTTQRTKSVLNTLAFKEYKRLTGSFTYMGNALIGVLMVVLFGFVSLFVSMDRIIEIVLQGAPVTKEMLYPAIPLILYFFVGMVPTTAISPSLEGKNYWIVQSLPISKKTLYQGKMLFHMYLSVPCMLFATICLCISAKAPLLNTLLYLVEGLVLCAFSTAWGCACGVKHMRLDWENEVEVVKQGAAVTIYLLPNMFVTMGLCVLVVVLGSFMNSNLITLILTLIVAVLAILSYLRVMHLAE